MHGVVLEGSRGVVLLKDISVYRAETISSSCRCFDIGLQKVLEGYHRRPLGLKAEMGTSLEALRRGMHGVGLVGSTGVVL